MHYKKTQISSGSVFDALHSQLGNRNRSGNSSLVRHSDVMYEQLNQLSGARLSQFSKNLSARFGTAPWKSRKQQAEGDFLGLSIDSLKEEWIRSVESYVKQTVRDGLSQVYPLRASSGTASRGQALADFAKLLSRDIGRNL